MNKFIKLASACLGLCMALSMTACGKDNSPQSTSDSASTAPATAPSETAAAADAFVKEIDLHTLHQPASPGDLFTGFWKITDGKDQYTRNSRIKKMTVDYLYDGRSKYADAQTFTLKDDKKRADWAKVNLKAKQKVTAVRVRIDSIYQGSNFKNDVCVSEIMFVHQK